MIVIKPNLLSLHPYYNILGLKPGATKSEIKKAFRRKAMLTHPDRNPDPRAKEKFHQINVAYEILTGQRAQPRVNRASRPSSKAKSSSKEDQKQTDREARKEKAREFHRKKEEAYRKSPQFKKDLAIGIVLDHIGYFVALLVICTIPLFLAIGIAGFIIGILLLTLTSRLWYTSLFLKKPTIQLKNLKLAWQYLYRNTDLKYYLSGVINVILFCSVLLRTFVYLPLLIGIVLLPIAFVLIKKYNKKKVSINIWNMAWVYFPLAIQLFFLINFSFTTPLKGEVYHITNRYDMQEAYFAELENKTYDEYPGIRFLMKKNDYGKHYLFLEVERGCFGFKTLKSYHYFHY